MEWRWHTLPTVLLLSVWGLAIPAAAYEVDEDLQGATLSGTVTLNGAIPKPKPLPVHRDSAVCGASVPDESLTVDLETRGIVGVVVSLAGVTRGKALPEAGTATIQNLNCRFHKRATAALVGSVLHIENRDPVMHNTHVREETRFGDTIINVAQPVGAPVIEKDLDETGLLDVRCDAHTFMRASLHVFGHPYFTVTDETGRFTLRQVPPGTYRLKVWHEVLGAYEQDVTVSPQGELTLSIELGLPR